MEARPVQLQQRQQKINVKEMPSSSNKKRTTRRSDYAMTPKAVVAENSRKRRSCQKMVNNYCEEEDEDDDEEEEEDSSSDEQDEGEEGEQDYRGEHQNIELANCKREESKSNVELGVDCLYRGPAVEKLVRRTNMIRFAIAPQSNQLCPQSRCLLTRISRALHALLGDTKHASHITKIISVLTAIPTYTLAKYVKQAIADGGNAVDKAIEGEKGEGGEEDYASFVLPSCSLAAKIDASEQEWTSRKRRQCREQTPPLAPNELLELVVEGGGENILKEEEEEEDQGTDAKMSKMGTSKPVRKPFQWPPRRRRSVKKEHPARQMSVEIQMGTPDLTPAKNVLSKSHHKTATTMDWGSISSSVGDDVKNEQVGIDNADFVEAAVAQLTPSLDDLHPPAPSNSEKKKQRVKFVRVNQSALLKEPMKKKTTADDQPNRNNVEITEESTVCREDGEEVKPPTAAEIVRNPLTPPPKKPRKNVLHILHHAPSSSYDNNEEATNGFVATTTTVMASNSSNNNKRVCIIERQKHAVEAAERIKRAAEAAEKQKRAAEAAVLANGGIRVEDFYSNNKNRTPTFSTPPQPPAFQQLIKPQKQQQKIAPPHTASKAVPKVKAMATNAVVSPSSSSFMARSISVAPLTPAPPITSTSRPTAPQISAPPPATTLVLPFTIATVYPAEMFPLVVAPQAPAPPPPPNVYRR